MKCTKWKNRISPSDYLLRFPNGPNAELAKEFLEQGKADYRKILDEALPTIIAGIKVLVDYFGESLIKCEPEEKTATDVLEAWIRNLIPQPKKGLPIHELKKARKQIIDEMLDNYGYKFEKSPYLIGPPKRITKAPAYWKLKTSPGFYLMKRSTRSTKENTLLALAAVAPFEEAIEFELDKIEFEIRQRLNGVNNSYNENMAIAIMKIASIEIFYYRYDGNYSLEFKSKIDRRISDFRI